MSVIAVGVVFAGAVQLKLNAPPVTVAGGVFGSAVPLTNKLTGVPSGIPVVVPDIATTHLLMVQ